MCSVSLCVDSLYVQVHAGARIITDCCDLSNVGDEN